MATVLNALMTDVLGYDSYIAQGGDWGGTFRAGTGNGKRLPHATGDKATNSQLRDDG